MTTVCSFDKHPFPRFEPCSHLKPDPTRTGTGWYCTDICRPIRDAAMNDHYQDIAACPDCQAAQAKRAAHIQEHETIDPTQRYGEHIALTCRNHPELSWNTKNISYIGARSIFYNGWASGIPECSCPVSDLIIRPKKG